MKEWILVLCRRGRMGGVTRAGMYQGEVTPSLCPGPGGEPERGKRVEAIV